MSMKLAFGLAAAAGITMLAAPFIPGIAAMAGIGLPGFLTSAFSAIGSAGAMTPLAGLGVPLIGGASLGTLLTGVGLAPTVLDAIKNKITGGSTQQNFAPG